MTDPTRQQDPFDTPPQWKNLEALERRLGEIEGRLADVEILATFVGLRIDVISGFTTAEEANAELEKMVAKRDQAIVEVK